MCGIFCAFSQSKLNITEKLSKIFQEFNLYISRRGPNQSKVEICHNEGYIFLFACSILWLQGLVPTKQPINEGEYMLAYNGDLFDDKTRQTRKNQGDTKLFLQYFKTNQLFSSLFHTNGPFAFVCLDKKNSILYFGRDKYGRRSLLIGKSAENEIILTSVAKRNSNFRFLELPSLGLFKFDLKLNQMTVKSWYIKNDHFMSKLKELSDFLDINIIVEESIQSSPFHFEEPSEEVLSFHSSLKNIELDNFFDFLGSIEFNAKIKKLKMHLESAIEKRLVNQPNFCKNCIRAENSCSHSQVGVLFSGGVDCAILAYLTHHLVPKNRPIDLLNVAFSNNNFDTPDRITGLQTLEELQNLCPDRKWNFVEINITLDELDKERSRWIADLIYPLNTILDDSLGCALWFASRGISVNYISPCRVLLIGTGADELFGGYSRHQAAFRKNKWTGLNNILREDWENLPYRNLGRDDRVVSDHGRQLRTPYLDEEVVEFVQNLKCWEKTLPVDVVPQEIGAKFFLRALAHLLGLKKAATLKKRALQFGSRIANSKENAHEVSPRL